MKNFLDRCKETFKKIKDRVVLYVKDNPKRAMIIGGVAVVIIALVIVLCVVLGGKKKSQEVEEAASVVEETTDTTSTSGIIEVPDVALEEDAYPEVNQLVTTYYAALTSGDIDAIDKIKNYTDDTEKIRIQKKSEYIKEYNNIKCYTKPGPIDGSLIVYAYYEVTFNDVETPAPGLKTLYLCKDDNGSYYIYDSEMDDNVSEYLKSITAQDDVVELFNMVDVKYNEAVASDEALNTFLTELPDKLDTAVGEALAALESTTEEATTEEVTAEETTAEETDTSVEETDENTVVTVQTTDTINVRTSASENADKLGKADKGSTYTRKEELANGWSKIDYDGQDAYVKSEYLEVVSEEAVAADDTTDTENTEAATSTKTGSVTVKETVNIRKSANETSDRLGVAYKGETYDLVMEQADGWCKITYKGQTGYVKSDYVE